jgi:hypothetical protein
MDSIQILLDHQALAIIGIPVIHNFIHGGEDRCSDYVGKILYLF